MQFDGTNVLFQANQELKNIQPDIPEATAPRNWFSLPTTIISEPSKWLWNLVKQKQFT